MTKGEELAKVRFHWVAYVARGGIDRPKKSHNIGTLEKGGLEHWNSFLMNAKNYLSRYPKDRYLVEGFVPQKTVKMLVGE